MNQDNNNNYHYNMNRMYYLKEKASTGGKGSYDLNRLTQAERDEVHVDYYSWSCDNITLRMDDGAEHN